jgi:hypothetical protein
MHEPRYSPELVYWWTAQQRIHPSREGNVAWHMLRSDRSRRIEVWLGTGKIKVITHPALYPWLPSFLRYGEPEL